jgi:hypothetical protein
MEENELINKLYNHGAKPTYKTLQHLVILIGIAAKANKKLCALEFKEHPENSIYIDVASCIQTFFINSCSIKEVVSKTPGIESIEFNSEQRAVADICRVLRNKLGHEGIWLPRHSITHRRTNNWKPEVIGFVYPIDKVKSELTSTLLEKIHPNEHQTKSLQRLSLATTYLDEISHNENEFSVVKLMTKSSTILLQHYMDIVIRSANKPELQEISELIAKLDLEPLEVSIATTKELLRDLLMKS